MKSGPQFCQISVDSQPGPALRSQTEYRKENETEWRRRKSFNKITHENTYTVGNLEPDTTYELRIVIDGYVEDGAETVQCHTSCKYLESDDVSIKSTSSTGSTAFVHIRYDPQINCPLSNYYYKMNNRSVNLISETFYISNFDPYHQYQQLVIGCLQLRGCGKLIFKDIPTTGPLVVPTQVRNINVTFIGNNNNNHVNVSWDEPYSPGGIQIYNVTYYILEGIKCGRYSSRDQKRYYELTNSSYVILGHLHPFAHYEGMVNAINQLASGLSAYFSFETKASEKISRYELVKIQFVRKSSNTIMVKPTVLPCEKYQGEHFYHFDASCSREWCDKKTPSITVQWVDEVILNHLHPFVSYTVKLSISRTWNGTKTLSDTKIIRTDTSDPNRVKLEVTTSGKTIGLRWKLPYPPTGILDAYNVRISGRNTTFLGKTNGTPCLWPGYHCVKIEKLALDAEYEIKLAAKNKGRNYKSIDTIRVITKEGAPDVPDLWSASWYTNNTLRLSWNHPNNTRGVLRQFLIQIYSQIFTVALPSEEDYKFTYKYEIQSTQLPNGIWCSSFPINLTVVNDFGNNSAQFRVYSPPPPISGTVKPLLVTETNVKVHINWTEGLILKELQLKLGKNSQSGVLIASCRLIQVKAPIEYDFYKNCSTILEPRQKYTIQVIMQNDCSMQTKVFPRTQFVSIIVVTTKGTSTEKYAALVLLILPLVLFLYCYIRKRNSTSSVPSKSDCDEIAFKPKPRKFAIPKKILTRGNFTKVTYSKRIKIDNLEKYIKKSIRSGELLQQFQCFKGFKALCENVPQQDDSQKALITYKRTIGECSKYVDVSNASFIDGYNAEKTYIVTQVPKQCALQKFWKMVWQEKVENIVTVINLNETGKTYWPDTNEEKHYGLIKVRYESNSVFVNFEIRIFEIHFGAEIRKLTQWHFNSWPDQETPLYSHNLAGFLRRISEIPYKTNSPILVHCSGGIGISGTIILSDICLRMAAEEAAVDFLARLKILRQLRPDLVENVEQYKLVHLVVYECVFRKLNALKCNDNMPKVVEVLLTSDAVQKEMEHLEDMIWLDNAVESTMEVKDEEVLICPGKNRFNDIEPGKYRVVLPRYPSTNDTSSYINAVQVNGSSNKLKYIVTQQPLPNTIGDFWRMVIENKSTLIVSLNEIDPHDKTICQFWPEEGYDLPVDFLNISHVKEQRKKYYRIVTLRVQPQLTAIGDFNLNIIQVQNWKARTLLPGSVEELLSFEEEAEVLSNKFYPTIVTCYDGATACGLYLAMALVMEKMKLERECDVSLAVRTVRHYRQQFVKDKVQYEFLYKAAVAYLEEFKPYPKIVNKQ